MRCISAAVLITSQLRSGGWSNSRWRSGARPPVLLFQHVLPVAGCVSLMDGFLLLVYSLAATNSTMLHEPRLLLPPPPLFARTGPPISRMTTEGRTKTRRLSSRQALSSAPLLADAYLQPGASCLGTGAQPNAGENSCQRSDFRRKSGSPGPVFHRRRGRGCVRPRIRPSNATIARVAPSHQSLCAPGGCHSLWTAGCMHGLHCAVRACATPVMHLWQACGHVCTCLLSSSCSLLLPPDTFVNCVTR